MMMGMMRGWVTNARHGGIIAEAFALVVVLDAPYDLSLTRGEPGAFGMWPEVKGWAPHLVERLGGRAWMTRPLLGEALRYAAAPGMLDWEAEQDRAEALVSVAHLVGEGLDSVARERCRDEFLAYIGQMTKGGWRPLPLRPDLPARR